jgi:DNA-binding transcriptional MerR regulator
VNGNSDSLLTIQQAAALTGLSVHTLRYYERIKLLARVDRAANGHRRFRKQDVEQLVFLNLIRLTGMPLEQVKQYIAVRDKGDGGTQDRVKMLQSHRALVAG